MEAPATNRLPNTLGYVYDEEDSYTRFEDEEARAMVSAAYNSAQSYAVGDLCVYNNKMWKATKATSGTWDATAWKETTLAEVNAGMRSDITNLTEETRAMVSAAYNSAQSYAVGDLCIYNNKLWKATKATSGTWDATAWKETTLAEVNAGMRSDITNLTEKIQWSDRIALGDNGCGIKLWYRYNEGLKLCELQWDGSTTGAFTVNSDGYTWNGFPEDKVPQWNIFIPVVSGENGLMIPYFNTDKQFKLKALVSDVTRTGLYICGRYTYCYQ